MKLSDKSIDNGKPFDWGRTSADYAKYRDIYPQAFYDKIIGRGLCVCGQAVLDVGTGTGVLPRNLYRYGARWTAADISAEQIKQAESGVNQISEVVQSNAAIAEESSATSQELSAESASLNDLVQQFKLK